MTWGRPGTGQVCENSRRMRFRFVSAVLLLAAFSLRLWRLDAQSIWFDEGWSWHLATLPLSDMIAVTAGDRNPIVYYTLLHAWIVLGSDAEFSMRLFSALTDLLAAAAVIQLGRRIAGVGAGLLAGTLYLFMPSAVWYAQEARMYSALSGLCAWSSLALWHWLDHGRTRTLALSALLFGLAVHMHYYAIFLLPAHAVLALLGGRNLNPHAIVRRMLSWGSAAAIVVATLIPWLLYARGGFAYDDGFAFPLNTVDGRLLEWLRWFAAGGLPVELESSRVLALGLALGASMGMLLAARGWQVTLKLLTLIVIPLLAATIAVRLFFPYRSVFHPRYLIYVTPMLCILLGCAGAAISRLTHVPLLIAPLALCGFAWLPVLGRYFTEPELQRDNTRAAVRHVIEALEPGDVVVMSRDNYAVTYYWPAAQAETLLAAPAGLHGVLRNDDRIREQLNARAPKRVRLLLWQDDVVDPQRFLETLLRVNGRQAGEYNFGQIRLPLYQVDTLPLRTLTLHPFDVHLSRADNGDAIALTRVWSAQRARTGDWFYAALEWQPARTPAQDYKAFVHVIGPDGQLAFQQDKVTLNALLPTSRWPANQIQRDVYAMVVPAELPAGRYSIRVGMYDPVSGKRLHAPQGDAVEIGTVEITR